MPYVPCSGCCRITSSSLRSFPGARRSSSPCPAFPTAIPAESYPRYSSRLKPSRMTETTSLGPTYPTIPHIDSYCTVHGRRGLFFEAIGELFDHRVGQYVAGNTFHFSLGVGGFHRAQGELEVLSLPHVLDRGVLHSFQRPMDGLPLRVEDGALQSNVNMRLHRGRL